MLYFKFNQNVHLSNPTGVSKIAVTVYSSGVFRAHPSGVRVSQYSVFCVLLCGLLFVTLSPFLRPLYCLSFNLRLLITPLVFSTFSYICSIYRTQTYPNTSLTLNFLFYIWWVQYIQPKRILTQF